MNWKTTLLATGLVAAVVIAYSNPPVAAQGAPAAGTQAGAQVKISPSVTAKAKNPPTPPANAQSKSSTGKAKATMGTKNAPADVDSFWTESIDVDGNGDVEVTDVLWDDEDKMLFLSYEDTFTCRNGATGVGAILIGLNAAGNARNRPVGSGFYIAELDKEECASQTEALWGCRFDANGNPTTCGIAVLDEKNDEIIIATASGK